MPVLHRDLTVWVRLQSGADPPYAVVDIYRWDGIWIMDGLHAQVAGEPTGCEHDEQAPQRTTFLLSALNLKNTTADQRQKYRRYIADECGEGYFSIDNQVWTTDQPFNFNTLLNTGLINGKDPPSARSNPSFPPEVALPPTNYVRRYRPGKHTLLSKDANNLPRKAMLCVSRSYAAAGGGAGLAAGWTPPPHTRHHGSDRMPRSVASRQGRLLPRQAEPPPPRPPSATPILPDKSRRPDRDMTKHSAISCGKEGLSRGESAEQKNNLWRWGIDTARDAG